MDVRFVDTLAAVSPADWNALAGTDDPFLRHEFLAALERQGCVSRELGWVPHHALGFEQGRLRAAAPMYLKSNSYGELVFDWAWADAYQRAGLAYYPKLVVAVPYTPVTGRRLLLADAPEPAGRAPALIEAALEESRRLGVSSLHWLFPTETDTQTLEGQGLLRRLGHQFHWHNPGYRDFQDFLDTFSAEKRKKVKRERRRVAEQQVSIEVVGGERASEAQWQAMHAFYRSTFDRKWGIPTLNLAFFLDIATAMGEQLLLVLARHQGRYVAGALNLRGSQALFGRHWGCSAEFHSLHFELCYYQGIDYCIREGLLRFEPGAQGEYKLSRGFLPAPTWSAHWIADLRFRQAIGRHLAHETTMVRDYMDDLEQHSPYKSTG